MNHDELSGITQRKQRMSDIFDAAAATYDRVGPHYFSHFGRRLVEIARIPRGSSVLDVATGRGAVLFPAAEAVGPQGRVVGIDFSEVMVQETRKELAHRKMLPNVTVRQMDAEYLQFPDASFDYVLCGFAIFFFPQLERALSEFQRVLKPAGQICVSTFDKHMDEEWRWFDEVVHAYLPPEPEAPQAAETDPEPQPVFNTPEGLRAIMKAAGFENIAVVSESAEFVYASAEVFWSTLWSHGMRGTLERIEEVTGSTGLQRFKVEVFAKVRDIMHGDGLHQSLPVHITLAAKPGN